MYRIVYVEFNKKKSKDVNTLTEAFAVWGRLPFQSFVEIYKIGS